MSQSVVKFPSPKFQDYTCKEDFINAGVPYLTPMTALEVEDEEDQQMLFDDPNYYVEEKLDGTRGTLILYDTYCRLFSRRISKKTDWFNENTDSVPHLRDYEDCQLSMTPVNLEGTVLDGEMYIPRRPFKDVSATLNCNWNEAVTRQMKLGKICIRVFDIRYYKGIKLENMPLHRRKVYLQRVVDQLASPYVVMHDFYEQSVPFTPDMWERVQNYKGDLESEYPALFDETFNYYEDLPEGDVNTMSQKAYYEYIVLCGGEGVILKKKDGKYFEKRGREYQKIKKFITREVIIMGYSEPTKEYTGKFPNDRWGYWIDLNDNRQNADIMSQTSAKELRNRGLVPVTHFWFHQQIGTVQFGVYATQEDVDSLPAKCKNDIIDMGSINTKKGLPRYIVRVGECAGFDDATRDEISSNKDRFIHRVIEVKANEVFTDTGRLRHPRFMRFRDDKNESECNWKEHTHSSPVYVKEY